MRSVLAYLVCALVWGTTWFAIRVCIGDGGYPTIPAAALRFTLAIVILLPIVWLGYAKPGPKHRAQWLWLGLAGLLNAVGYSLVYLGEENVSGGLAAVLFGLEPLAVAFMVTITRAERVSRAELLGALIALVGVAIIFADRVAVSSEQGVGIGFILIAVVVSAIYALIIKKKASDVHPLASCAVFLTVTTVALWVFALAQGIDPIPWPPPTKPTIALVYLALFGSVIAFATFFYLLKQISLMASSTLVFLLPIVALIVDWIWEDEVTMVARTYAGVGVALLGVLVSFLFKPSANDRAASSLAAEGEQSSVLGDPLEEALPQRSVVEPSSELA